MIKIVKKKIKVVIKKIKGCDYPRKEYTPVGNPFIYDKQLRGRW